MITEASSFNVSLRGDTANQLFLVPFYRDLQPMEMDIFDVMTNVVNKKRMMYAGTLGNFLRKKTECKFNASGSVDITERTISVEIIKGETEECWADFQNSILMELRRKGNDLGDLTGTVMHQIMLERMTQATANQVNELVFFGDMTSGNEETNLIDGLWTKLIPELEAHQKFPTLDSNSGTPLQPGEAIELLDAVYKSASNELKGTPEQDRRMIVSNNICEQLEEDMRANVAGDRMFVQLLENGRRLLRFRGIPIIPMLRWQNLYEKHVGVSDANLVLYTTVRNLVIATDAQDSMMEIRSWYNNEDDVVRNRLTFKLGFNYVHDTYLVAAK